MNLAYAIELYRATNPEQMTPAQHLLVQIAESCARQEKLLQTAVASRAAESHLPQATAVEPKRVVEALRRWDRASRGDDQRVTTKKVSRRRLRGE
jgi:hypothetical protein